MNPLKKKGITMNRFFTLPPVNSFFFFLNVWNGKKGKQNLVFEFILFVCLQMNLPNPRCYQFIEPPSNQTSYQHNVSPFPEKEKAKKKKLNP